MRRSSVRRIVVVGAVVLVVAGGLGWWSRFSSRPTAKGVTHTEPVGTGGPQPDVVRLTPEQQQAAGVNVTPAERHVVEERLTVNGQVVPNANRTVAVSSRVSGRVVGVLAQLGDTVEAGEVLALVDSAEAVDALADLAQSESALALAQADRDREALLVEQKIGARKDLQRAETALQQAQTQRDKIRDKLKLLGLTDAVSADHRKRPGQRSSVPLLAPFRGTVIERQVNEGQTVEAASTPFRLTDLATVWVLLDVFERDLARVRRGSPVAVSVVSYPAQRFAGTIAYVSDVVDQETRAVRVRVEVKNPERKLKPGMFATADIVTAASTRAIVVPSSALQRLEDKPIVFVRQPDGTFVRRNVQAGRAVGAGIEIHAGLAEGEAVVTEGSFTLKSELLKATLAGEK